MRHKIAKNISVVSIFLIVSLIVGYISYASPAPATFQWDKNFRWKLTATNTVVGFDANITIASWQWLGSGAGIIFNTLSPTPKYVLGADNYAWASGGLTIYGAAGFDASVISTSISGTNLRLYESTARLSSVSYDSVTARLSVSVEASGTLKITGSPYYPQTIIEGVTKNGAANAGWSYAISTDILTVTVSSGSWVIDYGQSGGGGGGGGGGSTTTTTLTTSTSSTSTTTGTSTASSQTTTSTTHASTAISTISTVTQTFASNIRVSYPSQIQIAQGEVMNLTMTVIFPYPSMYVITNVTFDQNWVHANKALPTYSNGNPIIIPFTVSPPTNLTANSYRVTFKITILIGMVTAEINSPFTIVVVPPTQNVPSVFGSLGSLSQQNQVMLIAAIGLFAFFLILARRRRKD